MLTVLRNAEEWGRDITQIQLALIIHRLGTADFPADKIWGGGISSALNVYRPCSSYFLNNITITFTAFTAFVQDWAL